MPGLLDSLSVCGPQLVEVLIFYAWLAKFPLCLWPTVGGGPDLVYLAS